MSFFDDDPFDRIVREFFGESPIRERHKEEIIHGEEEDRITDFIEDKEKIYIIFELPGYDEKDVLVKIKGKEMEIIARKKSNEGVQSYLAQKLNQGIFIKKILPKFINSKNFSYKLKNGILEITFNKK